MKKLKGNCQLQSLEGVRKKLVDAVFIRTPSGLNKILQDGFAATAASTNGAFNVWRDDKGVLRGTAYRWCALFDSQTFTSITKAKEWVKKMLIDIQ